MSVMAIQPGDSSNFLCKRFAAEASAFFDQPDEAKKISARVPLENLFRVLEMFRGRNFFDETRSGILATEMAGTRESQAVQEQTWHVQIEDAVTGSIHQTFGETIPEIDAAAELQLALRWLATRKEIENQAEVLSRAKLFFSRLSNAL